MDENSSKPDANLFAQLSALAITQQWLDGEGSSTRPGHLLRTLVMTTRDALQRNEVPPEKDSGSLSDVWRLEMAPQSIDKAPLRSGVVAAWWRARQQSLEQRLLDGGAEWLPELEVLKGGGRGISTRYRIRFVPFVADSADEATNVQSDQAPDHILIYRIDPAKPALWLRLLLGSKPFPINSWRGYILLGSAVFNFSR